MAEEVQGQASEAPESSGENAAQIAVHWREEEIYPPPPEFVRQANAADPAIRERFTEDKFPDCFKEYADLLTWDQPWHTTLDTSNRAVLQVVRRRQAERLLQLRRPARGGQSGQDRDRYSCPNSSPTSPYTSATGSCYRQVNEFAALLRDFAGLRPATG